MSTSRLDPGVARAVKVRTTREALAVDLEDGRTLLVPIAWYPRLLHGTSSERNNWRLVGAGEGIHWPALDEDISVRGLLAGHPSGESQASLKKWLAGRASNGNRKRAATKPPLARRGGSGR